MNPKFLKVSKAGLLSLCVSASLAQAQAGNVEEVIVTGIRASLEQAMDVKREASGVVDAISAEDIGKFPDTNLAESLQRITGVSISRSGGEGSQITVRGLGPQFNLVTLNGRSMPNANTGRSFSFETLAAELVSGVEVAKTNPATIQSGGIGASVNVKTARPLTMGDKLVGSVKALTDIDAESTTPSLSAVWSKNFDDTFGILFAGNYQERDSLYDYVEVTRWNNREEIVRARGWGGPRLEFQDGDVPVNFYPTQTIQGRAERNRERVNASTVLQWAPNNDITATLDANYTDLKVTGTGMESAYWFEFQYDTPASMNDTETLTSLGLNNIGLDMFMRAPESRQTGSQVGLNVEWALTDEQMLTFDYASSEAERNPDRERNVNALDIQAMPLDIMFDTRGDIATHYYDNDDILLATAKLHQQDVYSNYRLDEIDQARIDYEFASDSATLRAGIMYTDQTKSAYNYNNNVGDNSNAYSFRGVFPLVGNFEIDWDGEDGDEYEKDTYNGLFNSVEDAQAAGYRVETIDHGLLGDLAFITFDPNGADSWLDTIRQSPYVNGLELIEQPDWFVINEETIAAYIELTGQVELADRPLEIVAGTRFERTSIDSTSLEQTLTGLELPKNNSDVAENMTRSFADPTDLTEGDEYEVFLPSFAIKYEVTDDVVLRFATSRTIARPELADMRSARSFGNIREGQEGDGSAGNAYLKPYTSDNIDFSAEWYFSDASYVSAGLFKKNVDNFVVKYGTAETIEGVIDPSTGKDAVFNINRPYNQDMKKLQGLELAVQHTFGESGFGVIANATFVDTDSPFESDQLDSSAVLGLSDSANLVAFYDKDRIQARLAYNWRDSFVEKFGHTFTTTTGEPTQVDAYGQFDLSASYDLTEEVTLFLEGINITGEEVYKYSRFDNQFLRTDTNSPRYALGVRASF
ncbi:TonB-dependent receptor [Teredinibacter turnerae]|uniref:TonB-dependent receptor n=1 Tax=Teredinibacter turnerae TaxID=2426 RepID=UPI0003747269|nr:TonB-dependent receptor [Teredinibacter turnerae]